jgi:hypothetical protein
MRHRTVDIWIAWFGGATLATFEAAHLLGFVSELIPRQYAFLMPVATVGFFTVALSLSHSKHPHVVLEGIFAPQGTPEHESSGIFIGNIGDSPAANVMIEPIGNEFFGVSFDPVASVAVGDHKAVKMQYGSEVKDMFGVGAVLSMKNVIIRGPGQKADSVPHPIRVTFENGNGRTEANEDFELRFVEGIGRVPIASRYIVGKRIRPRRTIRHRFGTLLERHRSPARDRYERGRCCQLKVAAPAG